MSVLTLLWIGSVVAATALWAAGFLFGLARGRRQRPVEVDGPQRDEVGRNGADATVRADSPVLEAPVADPVSPPFVPDPGFGGLDAIVRAFAQRTGHEAAVVADDLGFPVVGIGDHQEPLAALCGVLAELQMRAQGLLPVGKVERLTLETDQGLVVSTCLGEHEDSPLSLATLTRGPGPGTTELRDALHHFRAALARGELRGPLENHS